MLESLEAASHCLDVLWGKVSSGAVSCQCFLLLFAWKKTHSTHTHTHTHTHTLSLTHAYKALLGKQMYGKNPDTSWDSRSESEVKPCVV